MTNTMNQERERIIAYVCELSGVKPEYFDDWSDEQLTLFFSDLVGWVRK
jgi:hypothetical protein